MAIKSGFYDSYNGDRVYSSKDFNDALKGIIDNGVFPNVGNNLEIANNSTSTYKNRIKVKTGKAFIGGYWFENTSEQSMTLPTATASSGRYKSVVIYAKIDDSIGQRAGSFNISVSGSEYSSKQAVPTPTPYTPSSSNIHVINLGWVIVNDGSEQIQDSDIHSWIGTSICPYCNYLATEGEVSEAMENIIEELSDIKNNLFFSDGESLSVSWRGTGYVTNSRKNIIFSIPLPKAIPDGIRIYLCNQNPPAGSTPQVLEWKAVQAGNYIVGSGSDYDHYTVNTYNPYWTSSNKGFITFTVPNANNQAYPDSVNNDTCGIIANFTIYAYSET